MREKESFEDKNIVVLSGKQVTNRHIQYSGHNVVTIVELHQLDSDTRAPNFGARDVVEDVVHSLSYSAYLPRI